MKLALNTAKVRTLICYTLIRLFRSVPNFSLYQFVHTQLEMAPLAYDKEPKGVGTRPLNIFVCTHLCVQ